MEYGGFIPLIVILVAFASFLLGIYAIDKLFRKLVKPTDIENPATTNYGGHRSSSTAANLPTLSSGVKYGNDHTSMLAISALTAIVISDSCSGGGGGCGGGGGGCGGGGGYGGGC